MQMLIDDLLLLARLDEGRPLATERVDLVAVLEDAVDTARAVGPDWPLTVESVPTAVVVGDPMALRQVIDNLLANVRTHTPSGTPTVVRLRVDAGRDRGAAVLEVADRGPGRDAADVERVFERFYRVDPSRSRARGGRGLGLAVVAALVAAPDGSVDVESTPGDGATFRVRLTLVPVDAVPAGGSGTDAPGVPATRSSGR
jgi:two-component system OmpR family sensor kinase